MTPNKWPKTVRVLTTLCVQKPRIYTKPTEGKSLCLFCYVDDELSPADGFHLPFSLKTLKSHINKNHLPISISKTGQLPIPGLCAHAPPWGTLEKPSGSGSRSEAVGEIPQCEPALECSSWCVTEEGKRGIGWDFGSGVQPPGTLGPHPTPLQGNRFSGFF